MPKTLPERKQRNNKSKSEPYTKPTRGRRRKSYVMAAINSDIDSDTENRLLNSENEPTQDNLTSNLPIGELYALLSDIKQSQCTKEDFKSFALNVNNRISSIEERITTNDDNLASFSKRMDDCEKANAATQYQLELDKQRHLRNNISIFGIPKNNEENLVEIVLKVLQKFEANVQVNKIADCYRIKGNINHIIVVKLNNFDLKQQILSKKAKQKITLGDILSNANKNPIFINNHTTPFFGKLLAEGRKAAKDGKINACWLNSFGCQLKFTEDGKYYGYPDIVELNKLIIEKPEDGRPKASKRQISPNIDDDVARPKTKK